MGWLVVGAAIYLALARRKAGEMPGPPETGDAEISEPEVTIPTED
jgi:hypothetical protein